jgi:hypothetical protein
MTSTTGTISGTVTVAATGTGVSGITVLVYSAAGRFLTAGFSGAKGVYEVAGLKPTSAGDVVCFDASTVTRGTGYLSQCYQGVAWDPAAPPPSGTTAVPVTAGGTASGINASLAPAGAISGTVTAASGGAGVGKVTVDVFDSDGGFLASVATSATGAFEVKGLSSASTGDTVCFDASTVKTGAGFVSQCYQGIAWSPSSPLPPGVTGVAVTAGSVTAGTNASLATGGAISGTVTAAAGGAAVAKVTVDVFDSAGDLLNSAVSPASGSYTVNGLPASTAGDTVCFDASLVTSGTGFASECYKGVAWTASAPPPAGVRVVRVAAGVTKTGVSARLAAGGEITGLVTAASGGAGLADVAVVVFDGSGSYLASAITSSSGGYTLPGLTPTATGDTVCFDASALAGYSSQCYQGVAWDSSSPPPSGTTPVPVTVGAKSTGINGSLS